MQEVAQASQGMRTRTMPFVAAGGSVVLLAACRGGAGTGATLE
jgi:hypothetical protein